MEEDDIVKSRYGNTLYGDEPMREEGLQAQGAYKEVPRPSRGTPESSWGVYPSKGQKVHLQ